MKMLSRLLLPLGLVLSGCALGPLASYDTARTVGKGKHELGFSYGAPSYFTWNYGVAESFDLGLQVEIFSISARAKYALLNQPEGGFSLAVAGGIGKSIGGSHDYGDLLMSYKFDVFEPYATVRAVNVKVDPKDFRDEKTGDLVFSLNSSRFNYRQYFVGTRIWFTPKIAVAVEGSRIESSALVDGHANIYSGALICRL